MRALEENSKRKMSNHEIPKQHIESKISILQNIKVAEYRSRKISKWQNIEAAKHQMHKISEEQTIISHNIEWQNSDTQIID